MKKLILSLLLSVGVLFGLQAQQTTGNQAQISFNKLEHDYGTVKKNGNGETTFKFKNTGKAPLILSNVRSSCGCTVPTWPREPIMPGQESTITVRYNTANVGPINKSVTVESNASNDNGRVVLKIKGSVVE